MKSRPCPSCGEALSMERQPEDKFFPFCSEKCRNADLLGWLNGEYQISRDLEPEDLENADIVGMSTEIFDAMGITDPYDPRFGD